MSYPYLFRTPGLGKLAEEVDEERGRQLQKWGDQHHLSGTALTHDAQNAISAKITTEYAIRQGDVTWRDIAWEEMAEAFAEDPSTPEGKARLRTELIQVMAVAAAWIHDLDRFENAHPGDDHRVVSVVEAQAGWDTRCRCIHPPEVDGEGEDEVIIHASYCGLATPAARTREEGR